MYRKLADFEKSLLYCKKGKELLVNHYPKNHFDIVYFNYKIAAIYYERMEYQSALDHYLSAREVWVHY
mgnify:CR=1 FL=1